MEASSERKKEGYKSLNGGKTAVDQIMIMSRIKLEFIGRKSQKVYIFCA